MGTGIVLKCKDTTTQGQTNQRHVSKPRHSEPIRNSERCAQTGLLSMNSQTETQLGVKEKCRNLL